MKSITFLRKTWKKWAAGQRDDEQANDHRYEPQKSAPPSSMSISQPKLSHLPLQNCDDRPILRRITSRFAPDTAYRAGGSPATSQTPICYSDQLLNSSTDATDATNHSTPSPRLISKDVENSAPYQESLPIYRMLQPLNVSDNPGSTSRYLTDRYSYNSTRHARSTDNVSSITSSDEIEYPQKMFYAVSDLSIDANPRIPYHRSRSMPHLPNEKSTQAPSVSSVDASEGNFPLSLFPTPPPLITRKNIPPPLVLRSSPPTASPQSSRDSTPVGTPMTPRFLPPRSPSQSNFGSCRTLSRRVASISPPPFSPPNSPLPSPPICCEDNGRPLDYTGRPLRITYSGCNLKDALPFPATHRPTFSEPISDQSSLPIKKSGKPRPEGIQPGGLQACLEAREQASLTAAENNVQWGYAF